MQKYDNKSVGVTVWSSLNEIALAEREYTVHRISTIKTFDFMWFNRYNELIINRVYTLGE